MCFCFMCFSLQVVHKDRRFLLCWLCDTSLKKRKVLSGLFPFSILYLLRNGWMVSHSMSSSSEHSARDNVYLITFIYQNPAWVPSHTGLLSQTARHFISLSTEHWQQEIPLAADLIDGLYEHITRTCVCVCVADIFLVNIIVHDFTYNRHWFQFASMFPKMFIMIAL
jgi:hypothetical protein